MFWSALFNPDTRFEPDTVEEPGMEQGRLSRRGAGALRRVPHAAKPGVRARQPQEIRRRGDGGLARLQHQLGQGHRRRRLARRRSDLLSVDRTCRPVTAPPRGRWAKRWTTSLSQLAPEDIRAVVAYLRSVPAIASPDLPATLAPPAPASHKDGGGTADRARQDGVRRRLRQLPRLDAARARSRLSPRLPARGRSTIPARPMCAQIVISGTKRHTPEGAISMPAFGNAYSDAEIAAVANYVTRALRQQGVADHGAGRGGAAQAGHVRSSRFIPQRPSYPACGGIPASRRALSIPSRSVSGILDHPHARVMTTENVMRVRIHQRWFRHLAARWRPS